MLTILHARHVLNEWLDMLNAPEYKGHIQVRWGKKKEFKDGICAFILWWVESTEAEMVLSRERTREELEQDIVHELFHIILQGHQECPGGPYDPMYERGINRIVKTLCGLRGRTETVL